MDSPRFGPSQLAFLIGVPLAWAVLLLFHPAPDDGDIYGSLRHDASAMVIVHLGTLLFIGLIGAALYLLVRALPGRRRGSVGWRSDRSCCSTPPGKRSWGWPPACW